jgi:hypothetical protein
VGRPRIELSVCQISGLINFDCRIGFYVLLTVASQVGYRARSEIHVIPHKSGAPAGSKELRKRAFTGLIDSKSARSIAFVRLSMALLMDVVVSPNGGLED